MKPAAFSNVMDLRPLLGTTAYFPFLITKMTYVPF